MEERRCAKCGHQLQGCPNCKQKLDKEKPSYTPESHLLTQVSKPTKRGKIILMPSR